MREHAMGLYRSATYCRHALSIAVSESSQVQRLTLYAPSTLGVMSFDTLTKCTDQEWILAMQGSKARKNWNARGKCGHLL